MYAFMQQEPTIHVLLLLHAQALPSGAGDVLLELLRPVPATLLPPGECTQLCEPQQELYLPADSALLAGYGLPGDSRTPLHSDLTRTPV